MPNSDVPREPSKSALFVQRLIFPASAAVIAAWYFAFTLGANYAGVQVDGALYVLMAEHFSPFMARDGLLDYIGQINHLPPLYPLVLGWSGASGSELTQAHAVQTVCLLLSLIVLYRLTNTITDDRITALLVFWAFALLPGTLLYAGEIWSEFLYLLIVGGAFYCAVRARADPQWWWWAGALTGLAPVTRGVGILLAASLILVLACKRVRRGGLIVVLILAPVTVAEILGLGGGSGYLDIFNHYRGGGVTGFLDTLTGNLNALIAGLVSLWDPAPGGLIVVAVAILAPCVCIGFWRRLKAIEVDAIYALGYLGVLLIWPFPHVIERLIYALLPLLMIYATVGGGHIAASIGSFERRVGLRVIGSIIVLLALPGALTLAARFIDSELPADLAAYRSSRFWLLPTARDRALEELRAKHAMVATMRASRGRVAPHDCIHSRYPQAVMLHSRRLSWPAPDADSTLFPCRYHLVVSDARVGEAVAALAPGYDVIHTERVAAGVAGILVRYPDRGSIPDG